MSPLAKLGATPNPQRSSSLPYGFSNSGFSQDNIAGPEYPGKLLTSRKVNEWNSPYVNKTHSTSDEDLDQSSRPVSQHAFLVSPFATSSQFALTQDGVPDGSTVRLVQIQTNDEQVRRRRSTFTHTPSPYGSDGDSPGVSPIEEAMKYSYVREKSQTPNKVRSPKRRQYGAAPSLAQFSSGPSGESLNAEPVDVPIEVPKISWTLTVMVLLFVTIVSQQF